MLQKKTIYSKLIANAIETVFENNKIPYHFNEYYNDYEFFIAMKDKTHRIVYDISISDNYYIVHASSTVFADASNTEVMIQMNELINRINYKLADGCFNLDNKDGEICFKYSITAMEKVPSEYQILESIIIPIKMFEQYGPAIYAAASGKTDAKTAVDKLIDEDEKNIISRKVQLHRFVKRHKKAIQQAI